MVHTCINIHHLEDNLFDMMESGLFFVQGPPSPNYNTREFIHKTFTFRINPLFRF